jgi:uncharacterized protein with FMN-binding domain
MKPCIRLPTLILSAAAVSAAVALGSAQAAGWLPSGLLSRLTGEAGPQAPAAAAPAGTGAPLQLAAGGRYHDGSFTGPAYDTYYGPVQVRVTVQNGRVVAVDVPVYPADRRASQRINGRALPALESEVISAQSARVNIISGATLTSEAYLRSLNAALGDAGA